ncbi:MAG: sugar O-acyltransferase, partial [Phycisphaerae bacterium]
MRRKLIILGTGGNCIDILEAVREINASAAEGLYECAGFLDDDRDKWGRECCGLKVLGPLDTAPQYADCSFVNGIGSPANFWRKRAIIARTGLPPERFEAVIHPSASVSRTARVGRGSVVLQNVAIAS